MTITQPEPRNCERCGREITWRKKWARDWKMVKYCSERCRRTRPTDEDQALEAAIISLLRQRASGASICPSEAARKVASMLTAAPTPVSRTRKGAGTHGNQDSQRNNCADKGCSKGSNKGSNKDSNKGSGDEDAWRSLMEPARAAARRLVAQGSIEITQSGRRVDPSRAKGPIRLRLVTTT